MEPEDDDLLQEFIVEANEHLADIESDLLDIEEAGADFDVDQVNKVFRAVHSIKGLAGFFGLDGIVNLAHHLESVMNRVRSAELVPESRITDALLRGADTLREMVTTPTESEAVDISSHVAELQAIEDGQGEVPDTSGAAPRAAETGAPTIEVVSPFGPFEPPQALFDAQYSQGNHIYAISLDMVEDLDRRNRSPLDLTRDLIAVGELLDSRMSTAELGQLGDELPDTLQFTALLGCKMSRSELSGLLRIGLDSIRDLPDEAACCGQASAHDADAAGLHAKAGAAPSPPSESAASGSGATAPQGGSQQLSPSARPTPRPSKRGAPAPSRPASSLRVPVTVLDDLMNLAGELVLCRNQLLQAIQSDDRKNLDLVASRVDLVTSEVQETIMKTRMQPIGSVFSRFPRVVRDLSRQLQKECAITIEGNEVEVDKTIIEAIGDPLTHLVRNSVDHGVETPDRRRELGKPTEGTVLLRAYHQAGKVNISIKDDGAGMDSGTLRQKAVEKGLLTTEEATALPEQEALKLIFRPGFSMAEQVTDVSGRGVGMDVVRSNIEKLGGSVEIETELGRGTELLIKLPLTLAIIPSLIVRSGGERFAVSQVSISELVRVRASERCTRIDRLQHGEVLRLRGDLLPIYRLTEVLESRAEVDGADEGAISIVVVESGLTRFGLVVDEILSSQEIVVKPLGRHLSNLGFLAGATVLGDGRVAFILDIAGIATEVSLADVGEREREELQVSAHALEQQTFLFFNNHPEERFAIPVGLIDRIERLQSRQIECVGGRDVAQHRGETLPAIVLERLIQARPRIDCERLFLLVFRIAGREAGLVCPQLSDIFSLAPEIDHLTLREEGVLGSITREGHTVRLLDIFELVRTLYPEWYEEVETPSAANDQTHLLLAEDTSFFRNQMKSLLESKGFHVDAFPDGMEAWHALQQSPQGYSLVVTDIEMPNMNGIELAAAIRGDGTLSHLPIVAVTSLCTEEDRRRCLDAGITDFQVKLDQNKLIASVERLLPDPSALTETCVPEGVSSHAL